MPAGIANYDVIAFVNIVDVERAKAFYRDTLGLRLVSEDLPFALVFDAHGIMLRLAINQKFTPLPGTILGWKVPDIEVAVRDLQQSGVAFAQFGLPGQDPSGVWASPTGAKVAWFRDPDGNVLSLSQHPES